MDIVFHRIDQRPYVTVITRGDGVRYVVAGVGLKFEIPHDLAHLAIESALELRRGFWGTIAAGGVFDSMSHLDGRRPPHAEAHSREVLKANRGEIVEAEGLVALFNTALEAGQDATSPVLRHSLREFAFTPPGAAPRTFGAPQLEGACKSWKRMRALWDAVPIGGKLGFEWLDEDQDRGRGSGNRRPRKLLTVSRPSHSRS